MKKPAFLLSLFLLLSIYALSQVQSHRDDYFNPLMPVKNVKGKMGYLDTTGRLVIDYLYDSCSYFRNGIAFIRQKHLWGMVDTLGRVIAPPIFEKMFYPLTNLHYKGYWFGNLDIDTIRIFNENGRIYYQGKGFGATLFPKINRIVVHSTGRWTDDYSAQLLDLNGRKITEFSASGTVALHAVQENLPDKSIRTYPYFYVKLNKHLKPFTEKLTWEGMLDTNGKVLFNDVAPLIIGGEIHLLRNGKAAVLDSNLKVIIPFSAGYESLWKMEHMPYYRAVKNKKWGIISKKSDTIISFRFPDYAYIIKQDPSYFIVFNGSNYLHYNYKDELLLKAERQVNLKPGHPPVPLKYEDTVLFQLWKSGYLGKTYAHVSGPTQNLKYHFFEIGNPQDSAVFPDIGTPFNRGKTGLLDTAGREILRTNYPFLGPTDGDLIPAAYAMPYIPGGDSSGRLIKKWYTCRLFYLFLNKNGEPLWNKTFDLIYQFRGNYAYVMKNGKLYMLSRSGELTDISGAYQYMTHFRNGVRIVKNNSGMQALMDTSGKLVSGWVERFETVKDSTPVYSYTSCYLCTDADLPTELFPNFRNGLIIFKDKNAQGLMDSSGKIILPPSYKITWINNPYFLDFRQYYKLESDEGDNHKEGVADKHGRILIPVENFSCVYHLYPKIFVVEKVKGGPVYLKSYNP